MSRVPFVKGTFVCKNSRLRCVIFNLKGHLYQKSIKDYNNVFSEDRKILKVGSLPEVSWSLPHLPPLTTFFSWGRNILFQISGGGICPTCFETNTLCPTAAYASDENIYFKQVNLGNIP
jgi:hypothetical protein